MFHGGAKYSTDNVKCSTHVLNIPAAKYSTERVKCSTEVVHVPQRG